MMGKWHLAEAQSLPTNQGFDTHEVGILETTDGTLYPESMRRSGMSEAAIEQAQPYIWATESGELEKVRPYDLAYRDEIEGDIARARARSSRLPRRRRTLLLYVGWSSVHYPAGVSEGSWRRLQAATAICS